MYKQIFISALAMSLAITVTVSAATTSTGAIGFTGRVYVATQAVDIGPNGDVQTQVSAKRVSLQPLKDAKLAGHEIDLFDYFASYALPSAEVVTVIYR